MKKFIFLGILALISFLFVDYTDLFAGHAEALSVDDDVGITLSLDVDQDYNAELSDHTVVCVLEGTHLKYPVSAEIHNYKEFSAQFSLELFNQESTLLYLQSPELVNYSLLNWNETNQETNKGKLTGIRIMVPTRLEIGDSPG